MRDEDDLYGTDLSRAAWRKSSHSEGSGSGGNECIEVAAAGRTYAGRMVAARDSKNPDGPKLLFTAAAWTALLDDLKASPHPPA